MALSLFVLLLRAQMLLVGTVLVVFFAYEMRCLLRLRTDRRLGVRLSAAPLQQG